MSSSPSRPTLDPTRRRYRLAVGAAVVLGLVLRLVWARWVAREPQGMVDPARYLGYARVIADGRGFIEPWSGFPTAYYPPGYPWFVGVVAWAGSPFTDNLPFLVAVVQAFLSAASVALGAVVARRLAGDRAGIVAAFALAVYPNLIFHSGAILGETLYISLFLGFLAVALGREWPGDLTTRRTFVGGVVLGLAVMVRPISLAVIPAVALAWWMAGDRRRAARGVVALTVGVALCIIPWTVRNYIRMDSFVLLSTNTGDNLCIGHAPNATGAFGANEWCATDHRFLDGPPAEIGADREKTRRAIDAIVDDPGREPWLVWRRLWFMWIRNGDHDGLIAVQSYLLDPFLARNGTEAKLARVADVAYWVVMGGGLAGLVIASRRRTPEGLLLVGSALMTAVVPLAFFGDSRFKVPVVPLLIIAAATMFKDPEPDVQEATTSSDATLLSPPGTG